MILKLTYNGASVAFALTFHRLWWIVRLVALKLSADRERAV